MEYFILKPDGEQTGTYSLEQVRAMLNSGFIGPDAQYWHEGIADWQPVDRIEESINFPEPDPHHQHAPPLHKWSGSLARAIPSPHQQKRAAPAQSAPASDAPIAPSPSIPEPHLPAAAIPAPSRRIEPAPHSNGVAAPNPAAREITPTAEPRRRIRWPRLPRPSARQIYAFTSTLLALAILTAVVASRHPARSAFSQVTLLSRNDCVLLDQASIKPFEDDMHNAPVVARLKALIAASKDSAFVQTASHGLADEIAQHETQVTQKYLQAAKAQVIEPGAYRTVGYLDDNGHLVAAHAGAPWAAILNHGTVVYAYLGSDFQLRP